MRGRGALRGAVAAWFGLIVLEAVVSKGGSGKIAGALTAVDDVLEHLLDPKVPLLPDHSKPAAGSSAYDPANPLAGIDPNSPTAAAQLAAAQGAAAATAAQGVGQLTGPGGLLYNLPALTAYTNGAPAPRNAR